MTLLTDPAAIAGLVTREVRTGSRDGAPTRIAVAQRIYPTDQADLWDALTNAERIPRWFLPVSGELRVGGRYQLEGNANGVVEQCEEPKRFAVTWEMGPQVSWLEVSLTPAAEGTLLELAHEAHIDPEMWSQFGPGAVGVGWDLALMGLGLHLSSGAAVDPEAGLAFPTTPEGHIFVRTAAAGWAVAATEDGDDPAAAHAAAKRTIAFYTGASEGGAES
ncbi:SRPBCC family protein [Nocardia sp. NPDC050710]|uniref:SRPBCC family protein n=1 Tax=Nocardia sp. NPDC050710 TaxID=3157220 RepID=UPI0033F5A799